ncbi:MAG: phosphoglucosamine mutase [Candidatus Zixiibacteriota bacterium]
MLLRSVSGVRGIVGVDLTPEIAARHAAAFGTMLHGGRVIVASDTRPTGPIIKEAAIAGLLAVGCDVIDIGVAPTPTVPLAVTHFRARAGLAITASHNPIDWNALKFLGSSRAVFPPTMLEKIYRLADTGKLAYKRWDRIGRCSASTAMLDVHIKRIMQFPVIDVGAIRRRQPRVVFDAGGGAAAIYGPTLLERLGCHVQRLYCRPDGTFPRGPEPVPANLRPLGAAVRRSRADVGFAADPDSDRLAIVDEHGRPLGEERTLVLATYWVLSQKPGPVVVNLSTSQAVADVAESFGQRCRTAQVGEINVAMMMKAKRAAIGGEGNGGVIMPALHPGRDALLGMALVLSLLARSDVPISEIDTALPRYFAAKKTLPRPVDWTQRLERFARHFIEKQQDTRDGVKVILPEASIHARHSNTEPIVRIATEARTSREANILLQEAIGALGYRL